MASYRTVISSKGQVVIPAELRQQFGLKGGTPATWTLLCSNQFPVIEKREKGLWVHSRSLYGKLPTVNTAATIRSTGWERKLRCHCRLAIKANQLVAKAKLLHKPLTSHEILLMPRPLPALPKAKSTASP